MIPQNEHSYTAKSLLLEQAVTVTANWQMVAKRQILVGTQCL